MNTKTRINLLVESLTQAITPEPMLAPLPISFHEATDAETFCRAVERLGYTVEEAETLLSPAPLVAETLIALAEESEDIVDIPRDVLADLRERAIERAHDVRFGLVNA